MRTSGRRALYWVGGKLAAASKYLRAYFRDRDPTFWWAIAPAIVVCVFVFSRSPASNYIFDEQEALLANPYVNGNELGYLAAFKTDFWGLSPDRSIGSYRPMPNLIWRALWQLSDLPWLHHMVNVIGHAINACLVSSFALSLTRHRAFAWLAGGCFLLTATLTEAVTGVVGLADVLGGTGVLLALSSLRLSLPLMPVCVTGSLLFGLLSKESVIAAIPLIGWVALVSAPVLHGARPVRLVRGLLAGAAAILALVAYTYFRRHFFPIELPEALREPLPDTKPILERLTHEFLRWFRQPQLPSDPINNPLVEASTAQRVAGGLCVYASGLLQIVFPYKLSGDYSFAQQPIPVRLITAGSVLGAVFMALPPVFAAAVWVRSVWVEKVLRRGLRALTQADLVSGLSHHLVLAVGLLWVPLTYFPHSNLLVLLPTVRAERFWYLPAIGTSLLLALTGCRLGRILTPRSCWALGALFLGFQTFQARRHALDYSDDLTFWKSTREASPKSAKAQLNYAVMVGARGRLAERLEITRQALAIAPDWPMAHVYLADTLCRMERVREAFPSYVKGFKLAPNDYNLIALGLQCLWDHDGIKSRRPELTDLADAHPGTWLSYLVHDLLVDGDRYGGVQPKYRPRGYDEGPKKRE